MTTGDNEYQPSPNLLQSGNGIGFGTPSAITRRFRPRRSDLVYDVSSRDQSLSPDSLLSDKDESDTEQVIRRKRRKSAGDEGCSSHSEGSSVNIDYRLLVCIKLAPNKLAKLSSFQSAEGSSCTDKNDIYVSSQVSSATVEAVAAGFKRRREKFNQSHEGLKQQYSELKNRHESELGKRDDEIRHLRKSLQEHTVLLAEARQKSWDAQLQNEQYEDVQLENAQLWKMKAEGDDARMSQDQQHKELLDSLYERERQLHESFTKVSDELRVLQERDKQQVKEVEEPVHASAHNLDCECPTLEEARKYIAELERERVSLMKDRDRTFLEKEDAVEKVQVLDVKYKTMKNERTWWQQKYESLLAGPSTPSLSHLGLTNKYSVDSTKSHLLSPPKT